MGDLSTIRLATITRERAGLLLDETVAVDSKAGSIIVKLEDIPAMESRDGQDYRFYVAWVLPAGPDGSNYVNPHVHYRGEALPLLERRRRGNELTRHPALVPNLTTKPRNRKGAFAR